MAYGPVNVGGSASGSGSAALGHRYCEVTAGTTSTSNMVYAAAVGDDFTPTAGERITVRFKNGNSDYNVMINVNGTGAKNVCHNGEKVMNIKADSLYDMVYDGEDWNVVGMKDTNTTYFMATAGQNGKAGLMTPEDKATVNSVTNLMTESGYVSGAKLFSGYKDVTLTIAAGAYSGDSALVLNDHSDFSFYESRIFHPVLIDSVLIDPEKGNEKAPVNVSFMRDGKYMGVYPKIYVSRTSGAETDKGMTATVRVYWIEP